MTPARSLARRLLCVALLGLAAAAGAQNAVPEPRPGEGTIRGRLLYSDGRGGAAGADIVLYALSASGEAGVSRTTSDAQGRFEFAGIATDDTSYLVGARVAGVPFGETVRFAPGEMLREIQITVFEASGDLGAVRSGPLSVRVAQGCTHLRVWQRQTLHNDSQAVVLVPEDERSALEPIVSLRLPPDAAGFELPMGAQGVEQVDGEVRFWGPLYPGSQDLEFGYGIPVSAAITGVALESSRGVPRVELRLPEGQPQPLGVALRELPRAVLDGLPHRGYDAGPLAPGASLSLRVPTPVRASQGLRVTQARLLLELDDVMLTVDEFHRLESATARAASGAPLLCLPTPAGASDLRFSADAQALGLALDPSGVLAVHGPIPAGEFGFALRYQLPATRNPLPFERRFGVEVALLELIVADTGIVPETRRLHRRRPIRSEDRNYQALEAFAIGANETVSVALRRLSPGRGFTRELAGGVTALLALATLAFLLRPLRGDGAADEDADPGLLSMERAAVYKAIDDLDEDLATGKLSPDDHARMRGELRARAVELLRAEREAAQAPARTRITHCPGCAARVGPDARFCSQCGRALGPAPNPDERESAA